MNPIVSHVAARRRIPWRSVASKWCPSFWLGLLFSTAAFPAVAQQPYLKPANVGTSQAEDYFGTSVAISGDTMVVGAPHEDSSTTGVNSTPNESAASSGAAYVFTRSAGVWTQQAYLKPAAAGTTQAGDAFGVSVAISGDTIVVGAPGEASSTTGVNSTPNEISRSGAAYVFVRTAGVWTQQAYLKPAAVGTTQAGDNFGGSVSISGDTVVVGAAWEDSSTTGVNSTPNESGSSYNAGAAYIFVRSAGTWTQQAYLKPAAVGTTQEEDRFGTSVAVSGDTVVVGTIFEDSSTTGVNSTPNENADDAGAACVFVRNAGVWTQQAYLKPAAVGIDQNNDFFGAAVAVSGDTIVVGAGSERSNTTGVNSTPDESAVDAGAAYVFVRNPGGWVQQAYLKPAHAGLSQQGRQFGRYLAVSDDAVVAGGQFGAALVFLRNSGVWAQQACLTQTAVITNFGGDSFGGPVAISGDTVIVGASGEDSSSTGINSTPNESALDSGAAYVFTGVNSATPESDQDRDGLPDFAEAYFGTPPDIPNGSPTSITLGFDAVGICWPETNPACVTITPQWSPDLITWLASGETANGIPARYFTLSTPAAGQKEAFLDTTGLPRASLRLRITYR